MNANSMPMSLLLAAAILCQHDVVSIDGSWVSLASLSRSPSAMKEISASNEQLASIRLVHLEIDERQERLRSLRVVELSKRREFDGDLRDWIGDKPQTNTGKAAQIIKETLSDEQWFRLLQIQNQCLGMTSVLLKHNIEGFRVSEAVVSDVKRLMAEHQLRLKTLSESQIFETTNPNIAQRQQHDVALGEWTRELKSTRAQLTGLIGAPTLLQLFGPAVNCSKIRREVAEAEGLRTAKRNRPVARPLEHQYLLLHFVICPVVSQLLEISPRQREHFLGIVRRESKSFLAWHSATTNKPAEEPPWNRTPFGKRIDRFDDEVLEVLDSRQKKELFRLYFQLLGISSAFEPRGNKLFNVTRAQIDAWAREIKSQHKVDLTAAGLKVLTPEQRKAWETYCGAPIQPDVRKVVEDWLSADRDEIGVHRQCSILEKLRAESGDEKKP